MAKSLQPKSKELGSGAWNQDYLRQFKSIKAALHSLQLQKENRQKLFGSSAAFTEMSFYFDAVDEAFNTLNTTKPERQTRPGVFDPNGKYARTLEEELGLVK